MGSGRWKPPCVNLRSGLPLQNDEYTVTRTPNDRGRRPKRRQGRPSQNSNPVGREALLDATCEMLASVPPQEVTRASVARHLHVDPSLIRYYFQNRDSLLAAAAERLAGIYATMLAEALSKVDDSPPSRLKARIATLVDFEARYPFFNRLLLEEVLPSEDPQAKSMIRAMNERGSAGYKAIIDDGVAQGMFRSVDRSLLYISAVALCEFFNSGLKLLEVLHGTRVDREQLRASYREFVCTLVLSGIESRPGERPAADQRKSRTTARQPRRLARPPQRRLEARRTAQAVLLRSGSGRSRIAHPAGYVRNTSSMIRPR